MKKSITKLAYYIGFASLITLIVSTQTLSHDEPNGRPHHIDVPANPTAVMRAFSEGKLGDDLSVQNLEAMTATDCDGTNHAGVYPCGNVDLKSFMPLSDIGQTQSNDEANDIWGWTDPDTGKEYAIIGRVFGTSFVDISNPDAPVYLGQLSTHGRFGSPWRDIKVYNNHAFIVSEARRHGMQVFDLTQLRSITTPPMAFSETAHYGGFGSAHNIVINEDSGFAYGVGTDRCSGGLAMVDIVDPLNPSNAGCYSADGYTHDAQCVNYSGLDLEHNGKEICFASNEDTLTIVDVSDKSNLIQISRTGYAGSAYTHQGWLTDDHGYFLLDDELDEQNSLHNTRTRIWDVSDLDAPMLNGYFDGATTAIDHNQYVHGDCTFQANYRAGLSINKFDPLAPSLSTEEGYFDIYPANDAAQFNAAWSNYPYFDSGVVIISGIEQGLFIVKPTDAVLQTCGLNIAPTASIEAPTGPVSGSAVLVQINATDVEDGAGTLTVEWRIDDGAWSVASYNGGTDRYEAGWDSSTVADGSHTITARVTDSGGKSASDSTEVTTANGNPVADMHVHLLSAATTLGRGGKWNVEITIMVFDASDPDTNEVVDATVTGVWSDGASGSGSCFTDINGICTITKNNINRKSSSATFTVNGISHATLTYDAIDNHDGNSIIVNKPNDTVIQFTGQTNNNRIRLHIQPIDLFLIPHMNEPSMIRKSACNGRFQTS
ncbi:MAG: choice-of-anchor B family protein [Porticoccus sp.]